MNFMTTIFDLGIQNEIFGKSIFISVLNNSGSFTNIVRIQKFIYTIDKLL